MIPALGQAVQNLEQNNFGPKRDPINNRKMYLSQSPYEGVVLNIQEYTQSLFLPQWGMDGFYNPNSEFWGMPGGRVSSTGRA